MRYGSDLAIYCLCLAIRSVDNNIISDNQCREKMCSSVAFIKCVVTHIISCRPIVLKFNRKITSAEGGLRDVDFGMNEIRIC